MKERIKEVTVDFKEHFRLRNYEWMFKILWTLPFFILFLLIDIVTKQIAFHHLQLGDSAVVFLPGVINFSLVFNSGIAFGTNQNDLAVTIPVAIIVTLIALILFLYANNKFFIFGLLLIFTGGVGNLIDRVWNDGQVVDFIAWVWFPPYSIFNISDAWVNIGIVVLVLGIIKMAIIEIYRHFKKNDDIKNEVKNNG